MTPPEQNQERGGVEQEREGESTADPALVTEERNGADQEKAQRLSDLISDTQMAASFPRHTRVTRDLAALQTQVDSIARDVRDLVNALAEHTASSRRWPNVVIIPLGDQDPARIAADLMVGVRRSTAGAAEAQTDHLSCWHPAACTGPGRPGRRARTVAAT